MVRKRTSIFRALTSMTPIQFQRRTAQPPATRPPRGDRLGHMVLLRVDAGPLLPRLRSELAALLTSLTDGDWAQPTSCPGWSVHDVAVHLLGVELGNVSVRRDRWRLGPGERRKSRHLAQPLQPAVGGRSAADQPGP